MKKKKFQRGQYVNNIRDFHKKVAYSTQGENTCRSSKNMVPPTCKFMHGSHCLVSALLYHPFTKGPFVCVALEFQEF